MRLDLPLALLSNSPLNSQLQREVSRYGLGGVPPSSDPRIPADAGVLAVVDASGLNRQEPSLQIERPPGPSLQTIIASGSVLEWPEVAAIMYSVARSQQSLCRASYVEVSPSSIFVGEDEEGGLKVRIAPPVLAHIINLALFGEAPSPREGIVNLPSYCYPPEMATGQPLNERSVVYELGAIAQKLLGSAPGNPLLGGGKIKLPAAFTSGYPAAVTLLEQATSERAAARPTSPRALGDAILALLGEQEPATESIALPISAAAGQRLAEARAKALARYQPPPPPEQAPAPFIEFRPPTLEVAVATLRGVNGEVQIREPGGLLGRPDAGVTPPIDISGLDPQRVVSRHHADLVYQKDGWHIRLRDTAKHKTFVNNHELQPGQSVLLRDGDTIRIARLTLTFHPGFVSEPAV